MRHARKHDRSVGGKGGCFLPRPCMATPLAFGETDRLTKKWDRKYSARHWRRPGCDDNDVFTTATKAATRIDKLQGLRKRAATRKPSFSRWQPDRFTACSNRNGRDTGRKMQRS